MTAKSLHETFPTKSHAPHISLALCKSKRKSNQPRILIRVLVHCLGSFISFQRNLVGVMIRPANHPGKGLQLAVSGGLLELYTGFHGTKSGRRCSLSSSLFWQLFFSLLIHIYFSLVLAIIIQSLLHHMKVQQS